MDLASMDREAREQLLHGTTITLVVAYSGTAHHPQQISAAKHIVARDRYRQLCEQSKMTDHAFIPVRIEFPEQALTAVSSYFRNLRPSTVHKREYEPDTYVMHIDLGSILPGYLMEVLDWFCSALRAKSWRDFLPDDPSVQECDKFFWLYIYITMRKLGMHDFANSLGGPFIGILVEQCQLVDEAWMLDFILEQLPEGDPLFQVVAERYVELEHAGRSPLFREQWTIIFENYAHFGNLVMSAQGHPKYFSNPISQAEAQLERLDINDDASEDMEL